MKAPFKLALVIVVLVRTTAWSEQAPSAEIIKAAVAKSLPLLEAGAKGSMEQRKQCFTCHNQGLPIIALTTARARGFQVDAEHLQTQLEFITSFLGKNKAKYLEGKGTGGQADTAGYALWTLDRGGWKPDETTAAVAEYLLQYQNDSDHWKSGARRPPSEQGPFTTSFVALRGLKSFGTLEQKDRIEQRFQQVRQWLKQAAPEDTEDRVFRLRALDLAGAGNDEVRRACQELLATQREDGGWSQLSDMESDAYATGSVLAALHQAGGLPTEDPAYRRGLNFLLSCQQEDGSWHVVSRSKPFQLYFESGYPHGTDQFISIAAASWATIALALALPEQTAGLLFNEGFDDAQLAKRGWYDGERCKISTENPRDGSGCIEYHWKAGGTTPDSSAGLRHLFEPSDTVYLRCYVKLSKDWGWTGRDYHPHLMHFMTTENARFHGPAASHLTVYIEPQEGKLRLAAQDIQNKDAPHGLTQGPLRGGFNGKSYDSREVLFRDDQWHCVEAMFQLNTLDDKSDKPNADGIVRGWFDGELVVDQTDVVLRSTDFPNMKFNQFLLTPYFGPSLLPHEQTLWIDELAVGTQRIGPLKSATALNSARPKPATMRVAAAQPRNRTIDWRLDDPAEVLRRVDQNLSNLERLIQKAGQARCDAIAFPEDTLGLLNWEVAHPHQLADVLPAAVSRMIDRFGRAAAAHGMYLVVCSDVVDGDGQTRNTALLLARDGRELGRYHKVNLPLSEQSRTRGDSFPVFATPDLGTAGMLICYDMVFPEAARCLALAGADVIFVPTLGGAAFGEGDINRAAFRTRAVDNFVWLIVAKRGQGSMIISPQGKVVAETDEADGLAIADIDPLGDRQAGDAFNRQADMRGRLFRERVPNAYGILLDPKPPVLNRIQSNVTREEAIRTFSTALTTGEQRFNTADALARAGKTEEAIVLFEQLCQDCPTSWIDRAARERLTKLRTAPSSVKSH